MFRRLAVMPGMLLRTAMLAQGWPARGTTKMICEGTKVVTARLSLYLIGRPSSSSPLSLSSEQVSTGSVVFLVVGDYGRRQIKMQLVGTKGLSRRISLNCSALDAPFCVSGMGYCTQGLPGRRCRSPFFRLTRALS